MSAGPQKYPGASTAYWYQDNFPGSAMRTNTIVWHSTEGTSLPSYGGGASAPNFTVKPDFGAKRLVWYQHFDFDVSSRALVNNSGGVETNTLNVCQVEVVGTCDPATHRRWGSTPHLYMPELPHWVIRDLGAFARWAHQRHGVPLTSGRTFKAYPGSYGAGNGVRMSPSAWTSFSGHCGHQHVPENLHGDPGAFPMTAILAAAKGTAQEDPMPQYVNLGTADPYRLAPGAWDSIEFTQEWTDELGHHPAGSSVWVRGASRFSGSLSLRVSGLEPGRTVQIRMSESQGSDLVQDHPIHELVGTGGDSFVVVPLVKRLGAGRAMRVRLLNTQETPVTIVSAVLTALVWKEG
ncbi:N-acetylmuramoyl-L-alanine amidase [Streptomyces glaucescens]|uniref:N-acetylmuramoyl-L-alanine amidase n=1 Tax=Streptomyces glaucescens TaxID=1907 RepID=UPI001B80DFFD|nr:N-acetylmuramoyl-L-alanine amidase [Streptomyces glaucescens]